MKNLLLLGALALSINAFGQVPNYVPTNGLVGWWPFNGNANDESANGNNGVVNGATLTNDRFGNSNSAYNFDGIDDYIIGNSTNLSVASTNKLTIASWINVNQLATAPAASKVFTHTNDANAAALGDQQYALSIDFNGSIYFLAGNGAFENNGSNVGPTGQIQSNTWVHLAVVVSVDSVKLYFNGNVVMSKPENDNFPINPVDAFVFSSPTNTTNNKTFNGSIDDTGIWNRALTQCEILALYNTIPLLGGIDIQSACDSYTWVDGNTYTTSNNSATYATAGCDSIITLNLTINPTPDNSITQNGASLTSTQTGATYQWIDCDNFNAPITGEVNQTFSPSSSGNYAVEVTIGDCSSTSECRLVDFTGIDEIESLISVHPNPTKDEVTLSIGAELLGTGFVVTDNAGRIILTDTFKSSKQIVNLTRFDNGVYFIRTDKESPVKIIKQ